MIKTSIFAVAIAAMAIGAHHSNISSSKINKGIMLASGGGSNCPVYYGCPAPPAPAPKGGGGGKGGADNPQPHA